METSYKEKYEQALERCRKLYNEAKANEYTSDIEDYETIFPELKENERIRKELIKHLKELSDWKEDEVIPVKNPSYYQQWASWLEKQELKSNPYSGVSFNYNGSTWGMCARDNGVDISCDKHLIKHLEKQGEQKIEENKGNIGEISSNSEWCEENEPHKELAKSYLTKFDEKFPILPTLKGKQLADYKNFLNKCQQIFRLKYWGIRPIQAKLFEKLSLLWAAWGAEHLQGLGQTDGDMDNEISMWSEEDEKMLDSICVSINEESVAEALRSRGDSYSIEDLTAICSKQINWLKSLRPQNRWKPSELQLGCLSDAIEHYNSLGYPAPKLKELLDDLKKLKGEV